MTFLSEDFLLNGKTSKILYHEFAKKLPIVDYHCHIEASEIALDTAFENITQVWIANDHYKWTAMRWNGISEEYITGSASDYDKFLAYAKTLTNSIGNPLYHWSHMELLKYFGYNGVLNEKTAPEVWELTKHKLQNGLSARRFMVQSNVELICTTDDPADSLEWHEKISGDNFGIKVLPAMRPDRMLYIEKEDFCSYMERLSKASGTGIKDIASLKKALSDRMDFFETLGCKLSDHGLSKIEYSPCSQEEANRILTARLGGPDINSRDAELFRSHMLVWLSGEYARRSWVMQLHFGVIRDINPTYYKKLGADAGGDAIGGFSCIHSLATLLSDLEQHNVLPKTILYSINPNDNTALGTIAGCFQNGSARGKIQHGSAWWFNDTKKGMLEHLDTLSSVGVLGSFIGMLTDSRSFLSYTRHDYFRRILCRYIGNLADDGEYANDMDCLKRIVENICYYNAKNYFSFK